MPHHVRAVFAALFCLFFAWFTTWMYMPAFMGVEIFGGDPLGHDGEEDEVVTQGSPIEMYNDGVRANSLGMTLASVITLLLAPALPWVARHSG